MENSKSRKIMFSGGGSGGPVTPLLAVAEELLKERPDLNLVFVGTKYGPVRELIAGFKESKIKFLTIPSGKYRRYFSIYNFLDLFKIIGAFFKSLIILSREKPDLVMSAGGFVSVPLVWAAACRRIPILIHQQDMRAGLANKLMAPYARSITVTFEKSLFDYGPRAVLTGNPTQDFSVYQSGTVATRNRYGIEIDRPLIVVVGGGTGSRAINNLIVDALPGLLQICQIVHVAGSGKNPYSETSSRPSGYQVFDFLAHSEMLYLMAAADLVISRSGLGTLTELSALAKPSILIPMPRTHQEDNANYFKSRGAAIFLNQDELDGEKITAEIKNILTDTKLRGSLSRNISKIMKPWAAESIAAVIWEILK